MIVGPGPVGRGFVGGRGRRARVARSARFGPRFFWTARVFRPHVFDSALSTTRFRDRGTGQRPKPKDEKKQKTRKKKTPKNLQKKKKSPPQKKKKKKKNPQKKKKQLPPKKHRPPPKPPPPNPPTPNPPPPQPPNPPPPTPPPSQTNTQHPHKKTQRLRPRPSFLRPRDGPKTETERRKKTKNAKKKT